jgi:predicted ribonuclease YlaK
MSDERILTVIPDANVLVHGRALSELPWAELRRPTIEVLFVPPVIRELDKLKNQSGRPNKIARQLSSDVRALLTAPGRRAEIRKSAPAVTKGVELRAITTSLRDALKLDHADQALIN